MDILHFIYQFTSRCTFGLLVFFTMTNAAISIHVQDFALTSVFNPLGSIAQSEISRSYGNSILNFLINCQTVLQNDCTFYVLTSNVLEFQFFYILTNTSYPLLLQPS